VQETKEDGENRIKEVIHTINLLTNRKDFSRLLILSILQSESPNEEI